MFNWHPPKIAMPQALEVFQGKISECWLLKSWRGHTYTSIVSLLQIVARRFPTMMAWRGRDHGTHLWVIHTYWILLYRTSKTLYIKHLETCQDQTGPLALKIGEECTPFNSQCCYCSNIRTHLSKKLLYSFLMAFPLTWPWGLSFSSPESSEGASFDATCHSALDGLRPPMWRVLRSDVASWRRVGRTRRRDTLCG